MNQPIQRRLEVAADERFRALRELRCGSPNAKLLILMLDHHVGRGQEDRENGRRVYSWSIFPRDLADECELSRSSCYKWLQHLENEGFITWHGRDCPGRKPTFVINWPAIIARVDSSSESFESPTQLLCQETVSTASAVRHADGAVRVADGNGSLPSPCDGQAVRVTDASVRVTDNPVRHTDTYKEERIESAIKAQSSAPSEEPDDDDEEDFFSDSEKISEEARLKEVIDLIRQTGVDLARSALEKARRNGLSLDQIADIANYAISQLGRWPPEVVYSRLTSSDAIDQQPEDGWFGGNKQWRHPAARTMPQPTATHAAAAPSAKPSEALKAVRALPLEDVRKLLTEVNPSLRKTCQKMLDEEKNPADSANRMVQTAIELAFLAKYGPPATV